MMQKQRLQAERDVEESEVSSAVEFNEVRAVPEKNKWGCRYNSNCLGGGVLMYFNWIWVVGGGYVGHYSVSDKGSWI